jgi:hypothetical protein
MDVTEPQVGQTAQQRLDRNLAFNAGQLGADAVMDSPTERHRPHVASGDVESIGVGVDRRVAIGRAEQTHDSLPFFQWNAADFVDVLYVVRPVTCTDES